MQFAGQHNLLGVGVAIVVVDGDVVGSDRGGSGGNGVAEAVVANGGGESEGGRESGAVSAAANATHIDRIVAGGVETIEAKSVGMD